MLIRIKKKKTQYLYSYNFFKIIWYIYVKKIIQKILGTWLFSEIITTFCNQDYFCNYLMFVSG